MVEIFAGEKLATTIIRALAPFAGAAALVAGGFAGGEAFEHRGPPPKWLALLGSSLKAQRDEQHTLAVTNAANWRAMRADRDAWKLADGRCEALRTQEHASASRGVTDGSTVQGQSNTSSFNAGYSAGRTAGRLTCGAKIDDHASPAPGPRADGGPGPVGMRPPVGDDFSALWRVGAYRPSGTPRADH